MLRALTYPRPPRSRAACPTALILTSGGLKGSQSDCIGRDERFVIDVGFEARLDDLEVRREVEVARREQAAVSDMEDFLAHILVGRCILGRIG